MISRLNINPALGNISEPDHYKGRMIYATSAVQVAKLLFRKVNVIIFEMFVFQENLYWLKWTGGEVGSSCLWPYLEGGSHHPPTLLFQKLERHLICTCTDRYVCILVDIMEGIVQALPTPDTAARSKTKINLLAILSQLYYQLSIDSKTQISQPKINILT